MPLLKERGHPWYWNEAFLIEIFCWIKPKSKSNIWAQSNNKAMLDARLLPLFYLKTNLWLILTKLSDNLLLCSHHQPLYLCIKYCGIPSCLGTSSFSVCKNRDTQEIEPTKKAKGSQWFEIDIEGEFSIVHLYFNFLWNNHKGQLFWEGNRNFT